MTDASAAEALLEAPPRPRTSLRKKACLWVAFFLIGAALPLMLLALVSAWRHPPVPLKAALHITEVASATPTTPQPPPYDARSWTWSLFVAAVLPLALRGGMTAAEGAVGRAGWQALKQLLLAAPYTGGYDPEGKDDEKGFRSSDDWSKVPKSSGGMFEMLPAAAFRLFFFHLSQPLAYMYVLYWCWPIVDEAQHCCAVLVLIREALYLVVALYHAWRRPAILLWAPGDCADWAVFVSAPEHVMVWARLGEARPEPYGPASPGHFLWSGVLLAMASGELAAPAALCLGGFGLPLPLRISYGVVTAALPFAALTWLGWAISEF